MAEFLSLCALVAQLLKAAGCRPSDIFARRCRSALLSLTCLLDPVNARESMGEQFLHVLLLVRSPICSSLHGRLRRFRRNAGIDAVLLGYRIGTVVSRRTEPRR